MHIHVIYTYTSLPTVHVFTHQNSQDGTLDFGSLINNDWALSSQLQQTWHQIFSSLNCYKSSSKSRTSEADQVKRKFSYSFGYLNFALNDSEVV